MEFFTYTSVKEPSQKMLSKLEYYVKPRTKLKDKKYNSSKKKILATWRNNLTREPPFQNNDGISEWLEVLAVLDCIAHSLLNAERMDFMTGEFQINHCPVQAY